MFNMKDNTVIYKEEGRALGYSDIDMMVEYDMLTRAGYIRNTHFKDCRFPVGFAFLISGGGLKNTVLDPRGCMYADPDTWSRFAGVIIMENCTFEDCNLENSFCIFATSLTAVLGITEEQLIEERTFVVKKDKV